MVLKLAPHVGIFPRWTVNELMLPLSGKPWHPAARKDVLGTKYACLESSIQVYFLSRRCLRLPKAIVNGRQSDFCSQRCGEAIQNAGMLTADVEYLDP